MPNVCFSRPVAARLAGVSAALLLALAAGCGGESKDARQIEKAKQTVAALTADGTFAHISDKYRHDELDRVFKEVKPIADSGAENLKAAAYTVMSRAKAGLAVLDAKAAAVNDSQLGRQLSALAATANTYTLQKSIAENNSGVGTQDLIKTLQASLEANRKNAAEAARAAAQAQAKVDELDTHAKQIAAQAQTKRDEASGLTSRVQNASATEGLEIIKNAASVRAKADELERQHAELATQLGLAQAELGRARAVAAALDDQTKQIQTTIASAQTRLEQERALAQEAGAAADKAAAEVKKAFADLNAFRASDLDKKHQDAVSTAKNAFELARQASTKSAGNRDSVAGGTTGKLSEVAMRQAYADALVSQARAEDLVAGSLAMVAGAKPALPNADEIAKAAAAARADADKHLTEARAEYTEIKADVDKISDDKLKSRLAETSRLIEALSSKQGISADAAPAAAPAAAGSTDTPAAATAPDSPEVAAIRRVIDQFHDKIRAGDIRSIVEMTDFADDAQRQFAIDVADFAVVMKDFDAACRDKLSASAEEVLGPMGGMAKGVLEGMAKEKDRTSADYKITVEGEKATAIATGGKPEKLVKKDGKWWMTAGNENLPPQAVAMIKPLAGVLKQLTADIQGGTITSAQQIQTALMSKLGALGGPGGGGGGGGGSGGGEDPNK